MDTQFHLVVERAYCHTNIRKSGRIDINSVKLLSTLSDLFKNIFIVRFCMAIAASVCKANHLIST